MSILDTLENPTVFSAADLSNDEYHRRTDYISRSYAHQIYRHGGCGQALLESGVSLFSGNAGTSFGTLFDELWDIVISGKKIEDLFCLAPESVLSASGQRRGKAFDEWKAEMAAGGKREISRADLEKLRLMLRGVQANTAITDLIDATVETQKSVFWTDAHGHRRRARLDGNTPSLVYDVKTTSSTWPELAKSFLNFGYFWQAHWYVESAMELGYERHRMPFICVQTIPPYEAQVFLPPVELVDAAGEQIKRTLDQIALRRETGEYLPADYSEIKELPVPGWMITKEVKGE
jgi:hypothetical protein